MQIPENVILVIQVEDEDKRSKGLQHSLDRRPPGEIRLPDDTRRHPGGISLPRHGLRHRGHMLGLPQGFEFFGAGFPVIGEGFEVDGGHHIVAGAEIRQ